MSDSEQVLNLPIPAHLHFGQAETMRDVLHNLLYKLWNEGEDFNGKRPFGQSGWDMDLLVPLAKAGLIKATFDENDYLEEISTLQLASGYEMIFEAIHALCYGE